MGIQYTVYEISEKQIVFGNTVHSLWDISVNQAVYGNTLYI